MQSLSAAHVPAAPEAAREAQPRLRAPLVALAALGASAAVWAVAAVATYEPGDVIGYNLGLAGGVLMLVLFAYPLRKRVRALAFLGAQRHWFSLHMALGIAGPVLIVLHSRMHLGSLNAAIAFWSMLLVAGSGIVGRFLYRRIHHGLYGRRTSLEELRAHAGFNADEGAVRSWMRRLPEVVEVLEAYGREADEAARGGAMRPAAFLGLSWHALLVRRRALRLLRRDLPKVASARGWDAETLARRRRKGTALVRAYVGRALGMAQFSAYERLFALWHVAHLPFVFMMVMSAVVHVVYVHMY
ncbi:MAG TPA: hypothetical protein VFP44_21155 [Usitatibacter sp.]|nr:hypothetical protein [Usitatibacter sp.]